MGVASDLYRGRNDFDFPRWWKRVGILSTVLVVVSLGSLFLRGLNLSIDFEGGSIWEIPAEEFTEDQAAQTLAPFGDDAMERFQEATTAEGGRVLRVSGRVDDVKTGAEAADALAQAAGLEQGDVKVNTVGPSWGSDITGQARLSLIVFLVLVSAYIAWRLETRMAAAALVAVIHDIIITVGVYSVFQIEVTPATVISFLTILGFSLYDTVVVFDKVDENVRGVLHTNRRTYGEQANLAVNQTLMRSINTTVISALPIISLMVVAAWLLGVGTLMDLGLIQLVGVVVGAYSSVFFASPLLVSLKERRPEYKAHTAKVLARRAKIAAGEDLAPEGAAAVQLDKAPARPQTKRARRRD